MKKKKPKDLAEYRNWMKTEHNFEVTEKTTAHYKSVTNSMKRDFEKSPFWNKIQTNLREFNAEYKLKTDYELLTQFEPEVVIKPFKSFLLKTYRKNVLDNKNWPDEPEEGWILPNCWYTRINDTIRTLCVVKYLDGVHFFIDKIKGICEEDKLLYRTFLEAREEGYYAAHFYTLQEFEIPKIDWNTEIVNVYVEIQITTQLQEVIRTMLHKYYEEKRKRIPKQDIKWQWDYKSDEFVTNYLGHMLHYVEGMILEVRDKQKRNDNEGRI